MYFMYSHGVSDDVFGRKGVEGGELHGVGHYGEIFKRIAAM